MSVFKVGDEVFWSSGAAGSVKRKDGQVYGIVPADGYVKKQLSSEEVDAVSVEFDFNVSPRSHESYLVKVDRGEGRKPALYWPLVSKLCKRPDQERFKSTPDVPDELPGMPEPGPISKACKEFIRQAHKVKDERDTMKACGSKIIEALQKEGRQHVTIEATGLRFRFQVKDVGLKLQMTRVKKKKSEDDAG